MDLVDRINLKHLKKHSVYYSFINKDVRWVRTGLIGLSSAFAVAEFGVSKDPFYGIWGFGVGSVLIYSSEKNDKMSNIRSGITKYTAPAYRYIGLFGVIVGTLGMISDGDAFKLGLESFLIGSSALSLSNAMYMDNLDEIEELTKSN